VDPDTGFLAVPPSSPGAERMYADDLSSLKHEAVTYGRPVAG
jgi:hypothetical protein